MSHQPRVGRAPSPQSWQLLPADTGYYQIQSVSTGLALDAGAGSTAGALVGQSTWSGAASQEWSLSMVTELDQTTWYTITAQHSGLALGVAGGPAATQPGAAVEQEVPANMTSQRWQLQPGYFVGSYVFLAQHTTFASGGGGYLGLPSGVIAGGTSWGNGPVCQQGTEWTDNTKPQGTDITIATLTGAALAQASAATVSTYKVVRAVAHVESPENFDALNAYDIGRVSLSPYHFTLFSKGRAAELPAFLSYLAFALPDEYAAAFARYGIGVKQAWPAGSSAPASVVNPLYVQSARKWATLTQQLGLQTAAGAVSAAQTDVTSADDAEYFRTWHWIYRWVMACRMYPDIWLKCWDLCRWRIQVLLAAPIAGVAGLASGTTLGQVYTSEYAVTALLRAHVNSPALVIQQGGASGTVVNSLTNAMANDATLANNLANWTNDQHKNIDGELVAALIAAAHGGPVAQDLMIALEYVSDTGASVSLESGSFQFDPP